MMNESVTIKILTNYLNKPENDQLDRLRGISQSNYHKLFEYFFPNLCLEFNHKNRFLIEFVDKMSESVIKLAIKIVCNNYLHSSVGSTVRSYPSFFAILLKNKPNLLIDMTIQDILTSEKIQKKDAEQIIYNVLVSKEKFKDEKQVKNFFTLLHLNDEILHALFNANNPLWFIELTEHLVKIEATESFLDEILWNDLYIKIKHRLDQEHNEGWDQVLKTIFYKFIEPKHSQAYKTIYSILDEKYAYKYNSKSFTFQTKYLDFLVIPYYATHSKYEILSTLFLSKNNKYLKKMELRFINNSNFEIDSCGLLFTAAISEIFDNYGLRQRLQMLIANIKIKDELFFYGDFRDFFISFINSLKYIKFFYGEARLFKLLSNCDWGEDINILSSCEPAFFKIKNFSLLNTQTLKSKPKTAKELHTIIFKIIGNHECSLNLISLNKDHSLDSINGLKIGAFKFTIPETNVHLNQFSIEMGNCIRGYTDKINIEDSRIINVFKDNKAYANIEIKHRKIVEIKGKYNNELPSNELIFFKNFLIDKDIINKIAI